MNRTVSTYLAVMNVPVGLAFGWVMTVNHVMILTSVSIRMVVVNRFVITLKVSFGFINLHCLKVWITLSVSAS